MDCFKNLILVIEFHPIYSIVKESYTQAPHYISMICIAFHIEVTPLADDIYELTQEPDGDFSSEAQANVVELTEAPNFDSGDPKSTDSIDISEGKP